mmetsp:Transcript_84941/g.253228  ORF Transcript_84941/g.253228 Transcript_84941/m.253228 type:complete len:214 (+) Transcript_84941:1148-1789(+)
MGPVAGLPQWFASVRTERERHATPPLQLLEHSDHSSHSPQTPSTHATVSQASALQTPTSSLLSGTQGLPPRCGGRSTRRVRVRWPPPQEQEQSLQSAQSLQRQSTYSQWPSEQASNCVSSRPHPVPPFLGCCMIFRSRWRWPAPQDALHALQCPHSLTTQSTFSSHGASLQPRVSMRLGWHCAPPRVGFWTTWRCLACWPPSHVLSHTSHSLH